MMEKLKKSGDVVSTTSNKQFKVEKVMKTKAKCIGLIQTEVEGVKQTVDYQLQSEIAEFEEIC